jgi:hypothetical protein
VNCNEALAELYRQKRAMKEQLPEALPVQEGIRRGNMIEDTIDRASLGIWVLYSYGFHLEEGLRAPQSYTENLRFADLYAGIERHIARAKTISQRPL